MENSKITLTRIGKISEVTFGAYPKGSYEVGRPAFRFEYKRSYRFSLHPFIAALGKISKITLGNGRITTEIGNSGKW